MSSDVNTDLKADVRTTCTYMLLTPFRRPRRIRRSWLRAIIYLLLVTLAADFMLTIAVDYPSLRTRVPPSSPSSAGSSTIPGDRVYIASMHWNNEAIIRSHWSAAVLDLVEYFGAENVYVSIIESGSWDDTKGALRDLNVELEKLGVERSIEMFENTHEDEIERTPEPHEEGWIWTGRGRYELRRIPYLANIRNRVMSRLKELAERTDGRSFDKILWLNDVIFTACMTPFSLMSIS